MFEDLEANEQAAKELSIDSNLPFIKPEDGGDFTRNETEETVQVKTLAHRIAQKKLSGNLVNIHEDAHFELVAQLSAQMNLQRQQHEQNIQRLEREHREEVDHLTTENNRLVARAVTLRAQLESMARKKHYLLKKLNQLCKKLNVAQHDLADERLLSSGQVGRHAMWQAQAELNEAYLMQEITELKNKIRRLRVLAKGRTKLQRGSGLFKKAIAPATRNKPYRKGMS